MPGLLPRGSPPACSQSGGIWSKHRDVLTADQLQKFWSELPHSARQELLRIDKQTLFEQARKNLYCSRCNGLLLEGFSQIVMYGKSLQPVGSTGIHLPNRQGITVMQTDSGSDDLQDPSVHPWGGLTASRDGTLTLLDCFIKPTSLKLLQNVFDSAKARERDREMLYPDACGGGGRGWISQGMANYGRGYGTRETCALHTARLACKTLVDFWRALGDEARLSLFRMKEEDFIERLMYRFDSKRFCRDCRRNVIREFKELKELKRIRRELCCTSWFCVADTAFQYEVSENTVQADWRQTFSDTIGMYHHFEWAVGTGEGKADILDFEDVGMIENVQVDGLDLRGLSSCFITLRAWKADGRCTELSVKAHALKGQQCVHRRLVIGDGYVTITEGVSIEKFFEHAEEAEEEEDYDGIDKDGNEYDGEGSRPQKHAKSPELAREFLLDAATVIFKEQVEKAFREGTARQNAHCLFVCLALKLLEERLHVACKEIITLEKQTRLLEEEENEKREEEERKERRRTKEREKKNRRKERLKGKERERERNCSESKLLPFDPLASVNDSSSTAHDDSPRNPDSGDDQIDDVILSEPTSPDTMQEKPSNGLTHMNGLKDDSQLHKYQVDGEISGRDGNCSFTLEQSKSSRRKLRFNKDLGQEQSSKLYGKGRGVNNNGHSFQNHDYNVSSVGCISSSSRGMNGLHRPRGNVVKTNARSAPKFTDKFHCLNSRVRDRQEFHSCSCGPQGDYRCHNLTNRSIREPVIPIKKESTIDTSRVFYRTIKSNHGCYSADNGILFRGKLVTNTNNRDAIHMKQVWEPTDSRKKCMRSSSDPDINSRSASKPDPPFKVVLDKVENEYLQLGCHDPATIYFSSKSSEELSNADVLDRSHQDGDSMNNSNESVKENFDVCQNENAQNSNFCSKDGAREVNLQPIISTFAISNDCDPMVASSSSDNSFSFLSEGDSSTSSSSGRNAESLSTSDSEDASPQCYNEHAACMCPNDPSDVQPDRRGSFPNSSIIETSVSSCEGAKCVEEDARKADQCLDSGSFQYNISHPQQHTHPMHNQAVHVPSFPSSNVGYHDQSAACWSSIPTNGFMQFHQHNHYMVPNHFGYGVPASQSSDFFMPLKFQPLTTTMYNIPQHRMYQAPNRFDAASLKEPTKKSEISGAQKPQGATSPVEAMHHCVILDRQSTPKPLSTGHDHTMLGVDKLQNNSSSFSLFHFGGPLAAVAGLAANQASPEEEKTGLFSCSSAAQADLACPKEEMKVEEYSLFATGNTVRFPFF